MNLTRSRLAAAAGVAALACSLTACGGSSNGHTSSPTTPKVTTPKVTTPSPTTTTGTGAAASGLATKADALCAQIDTAINDVSHLNLKSPTNEGKLASDFSTLNGDANNVSAAGTTSAHKDQVSSVVNTVRKALSTGEAAAAQVAKGNLSTASSDLNNMVTQLKTAKNEAASANLGNCAKAG